MMLRYGKSHNMFFFVEITAVNGKMCLQFLESERERARKSDRSAKIICRLAYTKNISTRMQMCAQHPDVIRYYYVKCMRMNEILLLLLFVWIFVFHQQQ